MNAKYKLIQRHKNPLGLALRVITYFLIGYAVWNHKLSLILLLFLVDLLNWFFMPMVKPENESKVINTIIEKEIAVLTSPITVTKIFSILTGFTLVILLTIGLWNHNWALLLVAFICLVVLKQLLLKTMASNSNKHHS
ncbi:MAG: hypothetical protein MRY83_09895 [Flavobacteriales bacterium]|nr:hypothetical protein [Flavobacteriales bacterium]